MDRALYLSLAQRASDLFDAGEHQQALDIFRQLVDSELTDRDKSMMWLNIGTVHQKMGNSVEALAAHDSALGYEHGNGGYFVASQRAAFLSQLGRHGDSLAAYQDLLRRTDLTAEDAGIFEANIRTLEKLVAGPP